MLVISVCFHYKGYKWESIFQKKTNSTTDHLTGFLPGWSYAVNFFLFQVNWHCYWRWSNDCRLIWIQVSISVTEKLPLWNSNWISGGGNLSWDETSDIANIKRLIYKYFYQMWVHYSALAEDLPRNVVLALVDMQCKLQLRVQELSGTLEKLHESEVLCEMTKPNLIRN